MELLTIIVCVLVGALISNLRFVKGMSEKAVHSARMASMEAELPGTDQYAESQRTSDT
jgi:hypothetical protein